MDVFTKVTLLSAAAVLAVEQILKLKIVPLAFANKYPVVTNILLSIVAVVIAVWQDFIAANVWTDWVVLIGIVAVAAAITYNQLVGRSPQLKEMEGEG